MNNSKCLWLQMFFYFNTSIVFNYPVWWIWIIYFDSWNRFIFVVYRQFKNPKIPGKRVESIKVNKIALLRSFIIDPPVNATVHLCFSLLKNKICWIIRSKGCQSGNPIIKQSFIILCSQERKFQFINFGNCYAKDLKK